MKEIVKMEGSKLFTTTIIIADGCGISDHKYVNDLVVKYQDDPIFRGLKPRKYLKTKGRSKEYFELNEEQAMFVVILMRNSEIVVKFKSTLVREFKRQQNIIASLIAQRKDAEWQKVRSDGKLSYKPKTSKIKDFVEYAISQGSEGYKPKNGKPSPAYATFSRMQNKALFIFEKAFPNMREVLTIKQLMHASTADAIIERALTESMDKGMHYKDCYKEAKKRVEVFADLIGRTPVISMDLINTQ